MSEIRLSANEKTALSAWKDLNVGEGFGFRVIQRRSGLRSDLVRRTVRALARKGLVEFTRSLWTEDDGMIGSGYTLRAEGRAVLDAGAAQ